MTINAAGFAGLMQQLVQRERARQGRIATGFRGGGSPLDLFRAELGGQGGGAPQRAGPSAGPGNQAGIMAFLQQLLGGGGAGPAISDPGSLRRGARDFGVPGRRFDRGVFDFFGSAGPSRVAGPALEGPRLNLGSVGGIDRERPDRASRIAGGGPGAFEPRDTFPFTIRGLQGAIR